MTYSSGQNLFVYVKPFISVYEILDGSLFIHLSLLIYLYSPYYLYCYLGDDVYFVSKKKKLQLQRNGWIKCDYCRRNILSAVVEIKILDDIFYPHNAFYYGDHLINLYIFLSSKTSICQGTCICQLSIIIVLQWANYEIVMR